MEDVVVLSYRKQIKESMFKAQIIKTGGFDIIVDYLNSRSIDTSRLVDFFKKIKDSKTLDDLNLLTMDELIEITDDIRRQVTHQLISQNEISDFLLRKSSVIAHEKSLNGVVSKNDKYLTIGTNLSSIVRKSGIAEGIKVCIKAYCNQKIYQANYREKLKEKEIELGIYQDEDSKLKEKEDIRKKFREEVLSKVSNSNSFDNKKRDVLRKIFGRDIEYYGNDDFFVVRKLYEEKFNEKINGI